MHLEYIASAYDPNRDSCDIEHEAECHQAQCRLTSMVEVGQLVSHPTNWWRLQS